MAKTTSYISERSNIALAVSHYLVMNEENDTFLLLPRMSSILE